MTRKEYAKRLRGAKRAKFEEKRELARQKIQGAKSSRASDSQADDCKNVHLIMQLGQPLRQFSEVSGQLSKLRNSFDSVFKGQITIGEVLRLSATDHSNNNNNSLNNSARMLHQLKNAVGAIGGENLAQTESATGGGGDGEV